MQKNRETEIKIKITEEIYNLLVSEFKIIKGPNLQENIFFDSKDLMLLKNRWALRLRKEDQCFILTTKGPVNNKENEYYDRPEIEEQISGKEISERLLSGFNLNEQKYKPCKELYNRFGDLFVSKIFSFKNYRTYIDFNGLILEADKTLIKDKIFFELEIETNIKNIEDVSKKIKKLFEDYDWPLQYSKKGKMAKAVKIFIGDIT